MTRVRFELVTFIIRNAKLNRSPGTSPAAGIIMFKSHNPHELSLNTVFNYYIYSFCGNVIDFTHNKCVCTRGCLYACSRVTICVMDGNVCECVRKLANPSQYVSAL